MDSWLCLASSHKLTRSHGFNPKEDPFLLTEESYNGNNNNLTNLIITLLLSEDRLSNNKRPVYYLLPNNNELSFNVNDFINPDI